jgi:hypothetical protein
MVNRTSSTLIRERRANSTDRRNTLRVELR